MVANRCLLEAMVGFTVFCILTFASRRVPVALHAMALLGLFLPLAWGAATGRWAEMGFTARNAAAAVGWGAAAGLVSCLIGFLTVPERSLVPDLGRQLAVGIPMWLLLASPFQEFFFRGWLQPRFERALGEAVGLLVTTLGFTAWHYLMPIFGDSARSSFPLYTWRGLAATFAAGLIYGVAFQRTGSILAPWLAHALAGLMFVALGAGSFIPPAP